MRTIRHMILAIAVIAVAGIGINAFAHGGGMGWGGGWDHHGPGWHRGGGYGYGGGDAWSPEADQKFEQQREAFFKDTQVVRNKLYEKGLELERELAKENPDAAIASALQQEISRLEAQFDQKRIDHMVEMRKLNPNVGSGFTGGGPMMGYGPSRGGACWE